MLGRVGTVFGEHGVNIVSAAVGRQPDGEDRGWRLAAMAITTDVAVPRELVDEIASSDGLRGGRWHFRLDLRLLLLPLRGE
jgi:D-3-phosphoglycerate dehydrogenase